jgi:hypothetical protein
VTAKAKELRQPVGVDRRTDPNCRACDKPPPKGTIRCDRLWAWSLRQPTPTKVFR